MAPLKRKLDRRSLQGLADSRLRDAEVLLAGQRYDAALYLSGYAIECALKACIARNVGEHDFPDKDTVNQSYSHNLVQLIGVAGLKELFDDAIAHDATLARYWPLVSQWSEDARYDDGTSPAEARDFFRAISDDRHGILQWIRQHW